MKTKTVYKFVVSLVLLTLLISVSGSVTQASTTDTTSLDECGCCLQTGAKQVVVLTQEDPYLIALQLTAEVKSAEDNFGTLLWDQAYLQSTEGNPWQVITVPIENKHTKETQLLFAGTQDGNTFVLVHREMEKWQPCYSSQTGGLNHETESGYILANATEETTPI